MRLTRTAGAFTLIEMLTVIAIIGVLAGLIVPAVVSSIRQARIKAAENDIHNLALALEAYCADWGCYPPDSMEPNPTVMELDDATHPSTPAECLVFYLGTRFTPASTNGNVGLGGASASLAPPGMGRREAYATRSCGPYMDFRGEQLRLFRQGAPWPSMVDPWGQPYLYNSPGGLYGEPKHNTTKFDIFSVGPNGLTNQGAIAIHTYLPPIATTTDTGWDSLINALNNETPPRYGAGNDVDTARGGNFFSGRTYYNEPYGSRDADDINNW